MSWKIFSLCVVYSFSLVAYEGLLQSDPVSVSHEYTGGNHTGSLKLYIYRLFLFQKISVSLF